MNRNLSINNYFVHKASNHIPKYRFGGSSKTDWKQWRQSLLPEIMNSLGKMPEKVTLNPQTLAEWEEDGVVKKRVIFDVEENLSLIAYILRPIEIKGKIPGIIACHGHGLFGKEPVVGNNSTPELRSEIARFNYDYGLKLAQAGYAVIAIDWRGFGDRDDRKKPHWYNNFGQRDICNLHYIRANILGMTVLGMNIHDGMCALDYLCSQDYVDVNNVGTIGLSFGGTMAVWLSLCDDRVKAANVVVYSDLFANFAIRDNNFCGSQITPCIYELCDLPDLQGLIAPRALLVEIGVYDNCFKIESALKCYSEVEKIYTAADAKENLDVDIFNGGHQWSGQKTFAFFEKHLL